MTLARSLPTALACLLPGAAAAQTSYIAPDGHNRYPAVTIFCPNGTGVAPCTFGSGGSGSGSGGAVSINLGGSAVSASNRLPVGDALLDGLISGGALSVSGTVGLAGSPTVSLGAGTLTVGGVSQSGNWSVGLAPGSSVGISNFPATQAVSGTIGLAAGNNAVGSVTVSNLPATQPVSGAVSQGGSWTVGLASGSNVGLATGSSVAISNFPATQPVSGTIGLAAGSNAVGSVTVSNLPATQPISGAVSQAGSWTVGLASGSNVGLATGSSVAVSNFPATQPVSGAVSQSGSWTVSLAPTATVGLVAGSNAIGSVSVSNLPATQAVSATSLPLPAGAATAAAQAAPLAPVAPGAGTASNAMLIGCVANTTLPSFTAGQQGAVPCDTSGRPYVVTVPSANNVPSYLQAVSSGGTTVFRAINAAASNVATSVKGSAGMVYGYGACNTGSSAAYLRLFAQAAAPTVGTSTPSIAKLIPAGACQNAEIPVGIVFPGGIGVDVTAGSLADSDTTTIAAANQVSLEIYYK